ncbi:alpha/beta hydrolase [Pediococcus claussenii]|uniref:Alpha/beta hydrolase n=1 Tax=Pediococcus claussenii (strain ATCC BAA-344 / DSM 14800 / JCM 18046 / KCTC 3811 / LMG 21948 / P06) TaxID=701521 RepID=G8PB93_PEDCP|nr:alpha/beta hydrolase [Pediococcus claussenii]AEV94722.1 hypothetical protein PECL_418 [Pediococcus claussenii ATCC BAA-344]ANZ69917.1 hypothetical protein AYR57_06155 [Pediococcus claussenii]ANZ71734.1 hypothetical protein AYR58_06160 [Pediococcus claussenii]KRN20901.1 hypothetical protein IV79_GL000126 [Pediococcus claussenii]
MKRVGMILLLVIVLIVAFLGFKKYNTTDSILKKVQSDAGNNDTVTIFVGGYGSSPNAFNDMVNAFHNNGLTTEKIRVNITNNGKIDVDTKQKQLKNETIQVAFKRNKDPLYQEKLFPKVMKKLHLEYNVNKVNLVGHSMGGLIELAYLTGNHRNEYPKVIKFATIATPYKRFFKTNNNISRSVDQIESNLKNVPSNLQVLNMGGHINGKDSDGVVPVAGIKEFGPMIKPHVASYKERIFEGTEGQVQHSNLRHNSKVIDTLAEFLWK